MKKKINFRNYSKRENKDKAKENKNYFTQRKGNYFTQRESKNYFTQYDIFNSNPEEKFVLLSILRRNFKPKFRANYQGKKDIGFYSLEEFLNFIYTRVQKHKSENKIYLLYRNFVEYIKTKDYTLNKKEKMIVYNFPKPKYQRKVWKKYYELKQEIKRLKTIKRKVRKKYYGKVLEEKLNNIEIEIKNLITRRNQILNKLNIKV